MAGISALVRVFYIVFYVWGSSALYGLEGSLLLRVFLILVISFRTCVNVSYKEVIDYLGVST